jgi:hypothetical protein
MFVAADDHDVVDAAIRTVARVVDADKWENDPSEKARRFWEWWVTRANDTTKFFNFWSTALRLVVLVQPSSAFVERVFSQIKLIIEQIGVSGLEVTVEARTMVRCNNKRQAAPPSRKDAIGIRKILVAHDTRAHQKSARRARSVGVGAGTQGVAFCV